ncbi:hypothetical protein [Sodalis-like endosymbiont of Proechinophthirus fluctus]|uniref:hypothetical protein n=1 Tax=Sodalis-like endosymbiont of Proechinophthirus fluctus TaxID=1462730 RepID=UPI000939D482
MLLARFSSPHWCGLPACQPVGSVYRRNDSPIFRRAPAYWKPPPTSLTIPVCWFSASALLLYNNFGEFRASILNDAFRGLVMLLGTTILLVAVSPPYRKRYRHSVATTVAYRSGTDFTLERGLASSRRNS